VEGLRSHPTTLVFLALLEETPIGVAVCFRGFSTFAARPLINIHDLYVAEGHRGRGAGRLLLQAVEDRARALGYCKLTLEVQEENRKALGLYESFGFRDPAYGGEGRRTLFRSKRL
jgi:ribosomal protein S18 acetylase RimI-like enzyme